MHFLINVAACLGKQAQKSALSECSCVCECSGWRVYVSRHCLRRYVAAHFSRRFVNFRLSFIHSDILHSNTRSVLASVYTILCFHLLSLRFNGHFPGEPGLAGVHWSKGCDDNWSYKSCKAPVNNHHQQTNTQFFTGRMPFRSPNKQCRSTEGKISHSMDLLTPSSPGGLPTLVSDH